MLDLTTWNLTIPVSGSDALISTERLNSGYSSQYFRPQDSESVRMWAPVTGSHTANSQYPRTELRETWTDGDLHNWYYRDADNLLSAVLTVDQVPSQNKVVIGQIHTINLPNQAGNPLVKLQYHYQPTLRSGRIEAVIRRNPTDSSTQTIGIVSDVTLGERFNYRLRITASGRLGITVESNGDDGSYYRQLASGWNTRLLYFKAGVYVLDNSGSSSEGGRATFFHLNTSHT